jgi:hypothetical protein
MGAKKKEERHEHFTDSGRARAACNGCRLELQKGDTACMKVERFGACTKVERCGACTVRKGRERARQGLGCGSYTTKREGEHQWRRRECH